MDDESKAPEGLEPRYQRYLGIPRHLIPWYPTIDPDLCIGCKECLTFCHDGVYVWDEGSGQVVVSNPWHCQVYCQSCTHACDQDAITFQDRKALKEAIRQLREKYPPE